MPSGPRSLSAAAAARQANRGAACTGAAGTGAAGLAAVQARFSGAQPAEGGGAARQGARNARDGIAYLQAAEGILREVMLLLQRAVGLAEAARFPDRPPVAQADREFRDLLASIEGLGTGATFNGHPVFARGQSLELALGPDERIQVPLGTLSGQLGQLATEQSIATPGSTLDALRAIDAVQAGLEGLRDDLRHAQDALQARAWRLDLQVANQAAQADSRALGRIAEVVPLARLQWLNRSGGPPQDPFLLGILAGLD